MSDGFEVVYQALCDERGGDALSVVDRAIVRQAAMLLSQDDASQAARVPDLLAVLPARVERKERYDYTRLNDRQLAILETLLMIAAGEAPMRRRAPRVRSQRHRFAEELADLLDAIERGAGDLSELERWSLLARAHGQLTN